MPQQTVNITKTLYSSTITKTLDVGFKELVDASAAATSTARKDMTIDEVFIQYNALFYDIPLSGSDNSHLFLVNKSLDYLGVSLDDLQSELELLRQENVELKNQILQISKINPGDLEEI